MTAPLDDAAVTALIKRLRGVDPEGRSYAHVMTPLTHSLIREAADALERLAADLAAVLALCGDDEDGQGWLVSTSQIRHALDSSGQTEGEQP